MDLFTAKKLTALRKYHSLSQEALAEKAGVSRQAVSKWERSEASPDTDNLLTLSRIYSVSVDDILGEKSADELIAELEAKKNGQEASDTAEIPDTKDTATKVYIEEAPVKENITDILINENDIYFSDILSEKKVTENETPDILYGEEKKKRRRGRIRIRKTVKLPPLYPSLAKHLLMFPYFVIAALIFVAFGFFGKLWHPAWLIFLTIPAYYLTAPAFFAPTKKKILMRIPVYYFAILLFISLGIIFNLWAYAWFVFLLIPIYYWAVSLMKNEK